MNLQEKYFYHNMERGKGALNLVAKLENKQTNKQVLQGVGKTTERKFMLMLGRQAMR